MTEVSWQRMWDLFHAVREKPPEEWAAFLEAKCPNDASLQREVKKLLASNEQSPEFLQPEAISVTPSTSDRKDDSVGARIGRYRILGKIGEGGMGIVYDAEQIEPVRRRVALKLIKLGMDTIEVIARFEAERQALAMMNHPNIARVHDAGATEQGRPYFVMELVQGEPITKYCDKHRLTTCERLDLFISVCHAVQHAHQKGIIHRDIKPNNVMVTLRDGKPVTKVIDFGVAKAVDHRLTERTVFTAQGQLIGTPEYMSPEQAEMGGLDIDTRTDVYSLGVLLYELLVGCLPFDPKSLCKAGFHEIQRIIREVEPPKPSTRLRDERSKGIKGSRAQGSEEFASASRSRSEPDAPAGVSPAAVRESERDATGRIRNIAHQRRSDPATLHRQIRGDLDWIVMKALDKNRTRRYGTPTEFAADILRYLRDEPVLAARPSAAYRLRKFTHRHRVAVLGGSAVFLFLLIGMMGTLWMSLVAFEARSDARREADIAGAISSFLEDLLTGARPEIAKGRDVTIIREMLDEAAGRVDREPFEHPEVEAALRRVIGITYVGLGLPGKARVQFDKGLVLVRAQLDSSSGPAEVELLTWLGSAESGLGQYDRSETVLREAIAAIERLDSKDQKLESLYADALGQLGWVLLQKRQLPEAESLCRRGLALRRRQHGPAAKDSLIMSLSALAQVLRTMENYDAAEPMYREALDLARTLADADVFVADVQNNLGILLLHAGRNDEAAAALGEAVRIRERILDPAHPDLAQSLNNLALVLQEQKKFDEAASLARRSLAILRKTLPDQHPNIASNLSNLADMLMKTGDSAGAIPLYREAVEIDRTHYPDEHPYVSKEMLSLGKSLLAENRAEEAEPWLRIGTNSRENELESGHWKIAEGQALYGRCLAMMQRYEEAEKLLTRARDAFWKHPATGPDHRLTREVTELLAELYESWDKPQQAAQWGAKLAATSQPASTRPERS